MGKTGAFVSLLLCIASSLPSCADTKGVDILKAAFAKLGAARTMSANLSGEVSNGPNRPAVKFNGTVAAMKPNFLKVELKGPGTRVFISDGKYYYNWAEGARIYTKDIVAAKPVEFGGVWEGEIDAFFGGAASVAKIDASYVGTEKVDGVDCDLVKAVMKNPDRTAVYAIGKSDKIIRRSVIAVTASRGPRAVTQVQTNHITGTQLNAAKSPADFTFKPPANAKPVTPNRPDLISASSASTDRRRTSSGGIAAIDGQN